MPRVPQKRAERGSQRWLQVVVNEARHLLDQAIAAELHLSPTDPIEWLSPLAADDHAEYRDATALARLGVSPSRRPLHEFWPDRGPQWDGLGRTSRGAAVLLEAKAHIGELLSPAMAATARSSRRLIEQSLARVKAALGSRSSFDWSGVCYQYANRLAHLYFLREMNALPAYLVFVYFLHADDVGGPRTAEAWAGAIEVVHTLLGIDRERLAQRLGAAVLDVFIDVRDVMAAAGIVG